jgi:hypothetical protein
VAASAFFCLLLLASAYAIELLGILAIGARDAEDEDAAAH